MFSCMIILFLPLSLIYDSAYIHNWPLLYIHFLGANGTVFFCSWELIIKIRYFLTPQTNVQVYIQFFLCTIQTTRALKGFNEKSQKSLIYYALKGLITPVFFLNKNASERFFLLFVRQQPFHR